MSVKLRIAIAGVLVLISAIQVFCQDQDSVKSEITIDLEIRPRAEYRAHYKMQSSDSFTPELYTSQRNRLDITYKTKKYKLFGSLQEIHLWGKDGKASSVASINAFELYGEAALSKKVAVRLGRQGLSLDNGRLFSTAPWAQQGRSHEGVRIFYNNKVTTTDLTVAFTRNYGKRFDEAYSPIASLQYKWLLLHHLKLRIAKDFTVTTINVADLFENKHKATAYVTRLTNGGRVEYVNNNFYATLSGYYQYGRAAENKKVNAYYLQPEISINVQRTTFRLGAEMVSGEDSTSAVRTKSFVPLYGVTWKFMGNMNLFTRFPADVGGRGLVNPYLFVLQKLSPVFFLRLDGHLFYLQHALKNSETASRNKYLGYEVDFSLNYKPTPKVEIIYGMSAFQPENTMEGLGKVKDSQKIPLWSYLMISWRPRLAHWKFR